MIYIVGLWEAKQSHEGIRLGTVRYPPRGKSKEQVSQFYDVWMPELAPSPELLRAGRAGEFDSWDDWTRRFLREMRSPATRPLIAFLARMSCETDLSVGCYCGNYYQCHRSLLHRLLSEAGAHLGVPYPPDPKLVAADSYLDREYDEDDDDDESDESLYYDDDEEED